MLSATGIAKLKVHPVEAGDAAMARARFSGTGWGARAGQADLRIESGGRGLGWPGSPHQSRHGGRAMGRCWIDTAGAGGYGPVLSPLNSQPATTGCLQT